MNQLDKPTNNRLCSDRVAAQAPSGVVGMENGPLTACTCGAGPHLEKSDRCERGHVLPGNQTALVAGHRSAAFWKAQAAALRELEDAVLSDAGHSRESAPEALKQAASGLAQAVTIRDSAFSRVSESGGPLTSAGRTRRALVVWVQACDRVERHLRLVGLKREPKLAPTLDEVLNG